MKKLKKPISVPKLKKKALDLFSELTKLRAEREGKLRCYTCGAELTLGTTNCQLGHFLPRGAYPGLTFHPNNSRPQCMRCNCFLHGATFEFRDRLIDEIGIERVEALEMQRHTQVKWSRTDLHLMIDMYSAEIKELKNN